MSASPDWWSKYSDWVGAKHPPDDHVLKNQAARTRLPRKGFAPYSATAPRRRAVGEASQMLRMLALACALALCAIWAMPAFEPALAQQTEASGLPPYGPPITLDQAKRVMAAAELQAVENTWQVAITILDSGGNLVMFHKIDNAQLSAVTVSEGKARTALEFKRPSKDLDDAIARGGAGNRLLALEGGLPIVLDGRIVGAIGVSGAVSAQDAQVAKAGADALAR
jgi:glc operon protein GlcG